MKSLIEIYEQSNKISKPEKLLNDAIIGYMKDKFKFNPNKITVKKKLSDSTFGDVVLSDSSLNKGNFTIHFNPDSGYRYRIGALIHELTHVKQISKGELRPSEDWKKVLWKNNYEVSVKDYKKAGKNIEQYKSLPWEKEAYENQKNLVNDFLASKYFKELKGKDKTLDFIIDNI